MQITGKRIILFFLCLFLFFCGIGIGMFLEHPSTLAQRQFIKNNIYLYDSQEKLDQWFRDFEKDFVDSAIDMNLSKEKQNELLEKFRKDIPIAVVGKIGIFHNKNTGGYQLVECGPHNPIAELGVFPEGREFRQFSGRVLEGAIMPHAVVYFTYGKDEPFVKSTYMVGNKDGSINRIYVDADGTGQFDIMIVNEDGNPVRYKMEGMTWVKSDKETSDDEELNYENVLSIIEEQSERDPENENVKIE